MGSLGVLNNISALYAENSLNQTQSSLNTVLQQLSSGQRINSGADDPAGLAVADGLAANQAALTQSAANATDGVGLLQTADGALAQVTNLLDSAVSIATEAANGTLTSAQVSSANQEYQNILGEIGDIGSTTNFNSLSVFSASATSIFVSDGSSSGVIEYQDTVGALSTTTVGTGAATTSVLSSATVTGASTSAVTVSSNTPSTTTAATATLTFASSTNTVSGSLTFEVGTGATTTVTLTSGESLTAAASQINSALSSVTGFSNAAVSGSTIVLTGITGATNTLTVGVGNLEQTSDTAATGTIALGSSSDTLSGTLNVTLGSTATSITLSSGDTLAEAVSQISTALASVTGFSSVVASGSDIILTGTSGVSLTITDTGVTQSVASTGVDFASSTISTLTASSASTVLTSITTAIADVAYQRGTLGADINELTAASNVASTEQVNLSSAQNSILATNYGQATSDLSKYQVLSQTGISALAQANSVAQEVLKLLQ